MLSDDIINPFELDPRDDLVPIVGQIAVSGPLAPAFNTDGVRRTPPGSVYGIDHY